MRASIDLHRLVPRKDCIIRQVFHALLLDHLLLLLHLAVQLLDRFLLLVEFYYQLVLLAFESRQFLLASTELALRLHRVLLHLLREIHECFQFFLEVFDFRFALGERLLVFDCALQLFLQALDMQLHLLFAANMVSALGLQLL